MPATEDAHSTKGKISATSGKATTLSISATQKAYVKFDLASFPTSVDASLVSAARLRVYVAGVKPVGSTIEFRAVTGNWQEDPATPAVEPASDPALISTQTVPKAKRFIYVDVTDVVKDWLTDPTSNKGVVISSVGGVIKLGSKEGSGLGYPSELEIDLNFAAELYVGGDPANGTIDGSLLSSNLTLGGTTMGTFSGNGSALTSLAAANISGQLASSQLASNLTLGGTTTGTFSGNGSALTSLAAANISGQLGSSQLASNLTLGGTTAGTFSGNGSALTNLAAANLTGTAAANVVATASLADGAVTPIKSAPDTAVFFEEAAANVGSPSTVDGWQARIFTGGTIVPATGGSIARTGNTTTLQPGRFLISAEAVVYVVGAHQLILRDIITSPTGDPSNASAVITGISQIQAAGTDTTSLSAFTGILTIASPRSYELWHYVQTRRSPSVALGYPTLNAAGVANRYCEISIVRLK